MSNTEREQKRADMGDETWTYDSSNSDKADVLFLSSTTHSEKESSLDDKSTMFTSSSENESPSCNVCDSNNDILTPTNYMDTEINILISDISAKIYVTANSSADKSYSRETEMENIKPREKQEEERFVSLALVPSSQIEMAGPLKKIDPEDIFQKLHAHIKSDLFKEYTTAEMYAFINKLFQYQLKKDIHKDRALILLTSGYEAVGWWRNDRPTAHKKLKSIAKNIASYNVCDANYILADIYCSLGVTYLQSNRVGKGEAYILSAISFLQNAAPSIWTATAWHNMADLSIGFGSLMPKSRIQCYAKAFEYYQIAYDHTQNAKSYLKEDIWAYEMFSYVKGMTFAKLQMPQKFIKKGKILQYGQTMAITHEDINCVQALLKQAEKYAKQCIGRMAYNCKNFTLILTMYLEMRKAQIGIQSERYITAHEAIKASWDIFSRWCVEHGKDKWGYEDKLTNEFPLLIADLEKLMPKSAVFGLRREISVQFSTHPSEEGEDFTFHVSTAHDSDTSHFSDESYD